MPKQTNLAELGWPCSPTSLQTPSCAFAELGEAVGLGESNWEASTAKHACFSGRSDSELRSFQRFMVQETSGRALLKIRHRDSGLRMLTSSKMDHDSRRDGYVEMEAKSSSRCSQPPTARPRHLCTRISLVIRGAFLMRGLAFPSLLGCRVASGTKMSSFELSFLVSHSRK
jgi:hypothetical protein